MKNSGPDSKTVFGEALALTEPTQRAAYLERACAGDPDLRREVESLLQAHEQARDFLSLPPPIRELPLEGPGTRIGRYQLLEKIGEGGFGVVYKAEQAEPVRRRVALKIIKLGMDTREVVARFEAERQALAMMDHPNIATVFDGGATNTGRPYFVMELVKGVPITDYCDVNLLSTQERLELFMRVCQAVQHAHQKGIIHRDLKPSNILVAVQDDRPVPKVIDFGVAKATQARLTEKTLFTRFHQWVGTPAYMSPEQAGLASSDVDTRSDVYSLGVLLYELLTGRTPFDAKALLAAGHEAVMRMIREEEPLKPSTRLSALGGEELAAVAAHRGAEPTKLGRMVRGDLDWIVMKALEKDRTRRYETANALARDLALHLSNQPVSAVAPSTIYTLQKMLRRHQAALATAAALVVMLLLGTGVSIWQAVRANREAREAARQRMMADGEATRANQLLRENERARVALEASLYRSQMGLAYEAWEKADVEETIKLLQGCPAQSRGWEWHYLRRLCASEVLRFNSPPTSSAHKSLGVSWTLRGQLVFSADGARLGAAYEGWGSALFDALSGQTVLALGTNREIGCFSDDGKTYFQGPSQGHPGHLVELPNGAVRNASAPWDLGGSDGAWVKMVSADGRWRVAAASLEAPGQRGRVTTELAYEVWDTLTGEPRLRIPVQAPPARFVFDETHAQLAMLGYLTPGETPALGVWDLATAQRRFLKPLTAGASHAGFSPDGRRLILVGEPDRPRFGGEVVLVLSAKDGQMVYSSQAEPDLAPDGRLMVATDQAHLQVAVLGHRLGSNGTAVAVRDLTTLERRFLKPVSERWEHMAFSPDRGQLVLYGLTDTPHVDSQDMLLLNALDGKEVFSLQADNRAGHGDRLVVAPKEYVGMVYGVTAAAFDPRGRYLALAVMDRTVQLLECAPPFRRRILRGHPSAVCAVAFRPDGGRLASMDRRGTVMIWEVGAPTRVSLSERTESWNWDFSISRDGTRAVWLGEMRGSERILRTMNLLTLEKQEFALAGHYDDFRGLKAADEFRIATGQGVWDVPRSNWWTRFSIPGDDEIALSRDAKRIAVRQGGTVTVWDAAHGGRVGPEYPVRARSSGGSYPYHDGSAFFAFSPDSRLLAVLTDEAQDAITVYRPEPNAVSPVVVCRIRGQSPICFGPTGDWLLAKRPGGGFLKADSRTGAIQREFAPEAIGFETHDAWEISPDGRTAVWYNETGTRVVSLEDGHILFDVAGPNLTRVAGFSADGSRLAAPGSDDQVRIWNVADGKVIAKLPVQGCFARFTADGSRLIVISPQGELSVLDGRPLE